MCPSAPHSSLSLSLSLSLFLSLSLPLSLKPVDQRPELLKGVAIWNGFLAVPAKYRKKVCHCYWLTLLQISLLSLKVVQGRQLPLSWPCSLVLILPKNIPRFIVSISLFPLPCCYSLVPQSDSFLQVICLSPTFDLARHTGSVLETMSKFATDIRMVYALRGERGVAKLT